ncbi:MULTISPECIES: hypothetical protein [unclassified Streptomyces]
MTFRHAQGSVISNDRAAAAQNLQRWTLTRVIKETLVPPTEYGFPHLG